MREIQLTRGQVAIVDDWNFEEIDKYKWYAKWSPKKKSFYAARSSETTLGKQHTIRMHMVISNTPKGFQTDHINGDTLDNRELNLRICTSSQNQHNRGKQNNNTSGFKGVFKYQKKWTAIIGLKGKPHYLGYYSTPEEAAHAYDNAAKQIHGEFAHLNFPED